MLNPTVSLGLTTAISKFPVPVFPKLSVAVTVKPKVPVAVGVPDMHPVLGSNTSPGGNVPAVTPYVYGPVPPLACTHPPTILNVIVGGGGPVVIVMVKS